MGESSDSDCWGDYESVPSVYPFDDSDTDDVCLMRIGMTVTTHLMCAGTSTKYYYGQDDEEMVTDQESNNHVHTDNPYQAPVEALQY